MHPTTTDSRPSRANIHCQPWCPPSPSRDNSGPDIGPEMAAAIDEPAMNRAVARLRWLFGSQRVK